MVVLIVQARMGSTRLPGKVLRPIAGRPMLSFLVERMRRCLLVDRIVVATTTEQGDDAIETFCRSQGLLCVRGSEQDVLSRFADAARASEAEVIVRVTADCPLMEPSLVDAAISRFFVGDVDFVSNMLEPTWPYGMAVEVFSRRALDEANFEAREPDAREHVTPFFYWHPDRYHLASMTMQPNLSAHRWTVDTPEDFELVSGIMEELYPHHPTFGMQEVLALLERHPEWENLNRHVVQKTVARNAKER